MISTSYCNRTRDDGDSGDCLTVEPPVDEVMRPIEEVTQLSHDALSQVMEDPIVKLLIHHTGPNGEPVRWTPQFSKRVAKYCCDEVLSSLRVRGVGYLLKYDRAEVYNVIGRIANPQQTSIYRCAAWYGRLDVLKWLRHRVMSRVDRGEKGWNQSVCAQAAIGGHLNILKWLRKKEPVDYDWITVNDVCPWDSSTTTAALMANRIDMLRWLRNTKVHGRCGICPFDNLIIEAAAPLDPIVWLFDPTTDQATIYRTIVAAYSRDVSRRRIRWALST
jgi:hypothetical protein